MVEDSIAPYFPAFCWSSRSADWVSTTYGCQFCCARGQLTGKWTIPCPRSRLRNWSRETGSVIWSRQPAQSPEYDYSTVQYTTVLLVPPGWIWCVLASSISQRVGLDPGLEWGWLYSTQEQSGASYCYWRLLPNCSIVVLQRGSETDDFQERVNDNMNTVSLSFVLYTYSKDVKSCLDQPETRIMFIRTTKHPEWQARWRLTLLSTSMHDSWGMAQRMRRKMWLDVWTALVKSEAWKEIIIIRLKVLGSFALPNIILEGCTTVHYSKQQVQRHIIIKLLPNQRIS